ncbi:hypothetical protein PCASD_23573 [Puccinia coronata f. sp. avenae]|uniref:Sas10 C-terminal domain-containing protein n=1 Tax=Puccinia coronata f. sp. avenae TaxID=200324 RepID=A0A2N5SFH0_9BASI|nr:hypothetical protein PCASD_23573 [Puccinia coronata f. sp. avenae]
MARGPRNAKRPIKLKPQNFRPDSGKFDPSHSSIKRLVDWDQEEAQDEQDDFFEGLDKVSLQQTSRDTRLENDLEIPEQLLDIDDGEDDEEEGFEDQSDSETEKSKPRKQRKAKVLIDNSRKGRFGKVSSAEETQSNSTHSDVDSDENQDLMQLDHDELEAESHEDAKLGDEGASSEEDESTWKSYHVTKSKSRKKKLPNDPEAVAEEEERRALELEEVKRLQAKARSKLVSSDYSSYLDYASEEEVLATEATKKLNQERAASSHSTIVREFDSEPEAVAYLLKTKPECLALLNDFRRSLVVLSELQDKISSPSESSESDKDQEKQEFNKAIDFLHYHVLSTYVSTTAFYMHLSLHVPPPAPTLVASVTKSLIDLRNTLNLMEQVGLIGDSSSSDQLTLDDSGPYDGQSPTSEFDKELRELLFDQLNPDDSLSLYSSDEGPGNKRLKVSTSKASATPAADEDQDSARSKSKKPKKKNKKSSKNGSQIEVEDPNELLKNLPPRPSTPKFLQSSEHDDRHDIDFLESTSLSEREATEKEKKKKSLRFYTAKIDAKGKRREKALVGTGVASGDSDLPYITKESQRREFLKKQDHTIADHEDESGDFGEGFDDDQPDMSLDRDDELDYYDTIKELKLSAKKSKKAQYDEKRLAERDALMADGEGEGASGPREISRQILKNKGLTPKRAKENRNPRVKKRKRFDKAQQKISTQRPTFKPDQAAQSRTLNGYQGEKSGVKVGVVKSRKL